MISFFLRYLPVWVSLIAIISSVSAQDREMRGLWVDAWGTGFLTPTQATSLVQTARENNFNAIFVQMRRRGDAFYMPQAPNGDPRTTALAGSYDALADLLAKAHSGSPRIEVHVWVTTHLIWSGTNSPSKAGHVYNKHPEYLMENRAGEKHISEGYYLDPGNPDAMRWTYNMAMDIVSRYDIDGFHWDYIRYPQQDSGYNPAAIARYNTEFGLTGKPAASDSRFSAWRRRQNTDFLRWVNADLLEVRPDLVISAAVFGSRSDAFNARHQDWSAWNSEGIIDLCLPMNYSSSNSTFNSRVNDAVNHQGIRHIYMGQGSYLNTKENTLNQLNYVRNSGLPGTIFYSYRTPNSGTVDRSGTFSYIKTNYQPTWTDTPELSWKTSKGIVKGLVTRADTGEIVYNANVTINANGGRNLLSCVQGSYAFFDLPPGDFTVSATAAGLSASESVTVVAGDVTTVHLVLGEGPPEFDPGIVFADFEDSATDGSGNVMFRLPSYSSTTSGNLAASPVVSTVTNSPPTGGLPGERSVRVEFAFKPEATDPSLRLTTHAAGTLANPVISLNDYLAFDIYTNQDVFVSLGIRETNPAGAIGSDGGASGSIEWVGGVTDNSRAGIPLGQMVEAGKWTRVFFHLPSESVKTFTGNGTLEGSRGVLESLGLVAVTDEGGQHPTTPYVVHLDNFEVTSVEPTPLPEPSFAVWAEAWLPEESRGTMDDPGGLGIPNLIRYAFGMDPLNPRRSDLPALGQPGTGDGGHSGNELTISFVRRTDDPDLQYEVEASDDLLTWVGVSGTEEVQPLGENLERVTVTDVQADGARRFLRVRVEQN